MNIKTRIWIAVDLLIASAGLLLFCSRDYNPFTDLTNAGVHVVSWPFTGKDSVALYTTGTLKAVVAVRNEVDSFVVSATGNRYWTDTTVRRTAGGTPIDGGPYSFRISFFDTGEQKISVTTYRSNSEAVSQVVVVKCYNPLSQKTIAGYFGANTRLVTTPVGDTEVFYQWDFGANRIETWPTDTHTVILPYSSPSSGTGLLRVTDFFGKHNTPPVVFSYSFVDTTAPIILCVNDSLKGDTLKIGDTLFAFRAFVTDPGNGMVDSCSINHGAFDNVNTVTHVYTKLFNNLAALTKGNTPLQIVVYAMGNKEFHTVARDTFWVVYNPLGNKSPDADIGFLVPDKDSTAYAVRNCDIYVFVDNYRTDSMLLRLKVNDSLYSAQLFLGSSGKMGFSPVYLDAPVNTVTVSAYSTGGRLLTSAKTTIFYNPKLIDSIKPKIYEVSSVNGLPAESLFTSQPLATLKIVAFDEGSGIKFLAVNGDTLTADSSGRYVWYWTSRQLVHSAQGNRITIVTQDFAGNLTDTTIRIFRDSLPVLATDPMIPAHLCVDSGYTFHLSMTDADNDSVTIDRISAPTAMAISPSGTVYWKPTVADTGLDSLIIRLNDHIELSPPFIWKFTVGICSQPAATAHFTTRLQDFPGVLQAGADTMKILLAIDNTLIAPLYSAVFTNNNQQILSKSTSGMLLWAPAPADTGLRQLLVTVADSVRGFDTLRPAILVVPKNQYPCSLSYRFTGTLTANGQLDLFTKTVPETLFFTINDKDNLLTEKYSVTIVQHTVSTVEDLNKKDFFIVIMPDSIRTLDTLHVKVRDMTNTSDSVTVVVRYSYTPPRISSGPGIPSLLCADSSYIFTIVTSDADGHTVTVNKLHAPKNMTVNANGSIQYQPVMADTGIDSLVVQLYDQYVYSRSYTWAFATINCASPRLPVKLQTSAADFPVRMQVGADSIAIQLGTKLGTGTLPFVYNVHFTKTGTVLLSNSTTGWFAWKPSDGDTGIQTLSVSVHDANNTADSILPTFTILPRNQYPCSLSYTFTGKLTATGSLDLFSSAAPETLFFKITDKDNPLTEKYSRAITQFGVTTTTDSSAKNFIVVLTPDSMKTRDTIRVYIGDKTGTKDTAIIAVRYQKIPLPLKLYLNTTPSGAGTTSENYGFPVLVRLTNSNFTFSKTQRNGNDIRFRKPDGTTLPFEIERWDSAAGHAEIWVKMDTVHGNNNSHYMELYWLDATSSGGSNSAAVFDIANGFRGVWHLGENTNFISDATANSYNGTRHGNQTQTTGTIGMGQQFPGTGNDYTEMGNVLNPGNNNFTVSAWIKKASNGQNETIIGKTNGGSPGNTYGWIFVINNANNPVCCIANGGQNWGEAGSFSLISNTAITDVAWHYVSAIINKTGNNYCQIFIDGSETTISPNGNVTLVGNISNNLPLRIGLEADNQNDFTGSLDEIVVSLTARSADWIKLCYMNQKSADALVEFR